jgi:hypothetical protein
MFSKKASRWVAGTGLALALVANLAGVGSASAQTLTASSSVTGNIYTVQSLSGSTTSVGSGSTITVTGASYGADEKVSFWINVPAGTTIPGYSLGQTDSHVIGTVIPLDNILGADANGAFTYTLNTSGLPAGSYSLVAHGLSTAKEDVYDFTVTGGPAAPLAPAGGTTITAGTMLAINATSYEPNEPVSLWINVPAGITVSSATLGQTDTRMVGAVVPLDAMTSADSNGAFTYTLNTAGLPSGTYSLVAHGLRSSVDGVVVFTVQ